jgi:hypothetical protein
MTKTSTDISPGKIRKIVVTGKRTLGLHLLLKNIAGAASRQENFAWTAVCKLEPGSCHSKSEHSYHLNGG